MTARRLLAAVLPASALLLAGVSAPGATDGAAPPAVPAVTPAAISDVVPREALPSPVPLRPPRLSERHLDPALGRFVAPVGDGRAILTLDPRLQSRLAQSLATYRVPWGATVLLEAGSGRVLALAEHSQAEPQRRGLALAALAPAASIFKIVTAAALLEHGVRPEDEVCYHGGRRRLAPGLLADDPRRDRRCSSLSDAFGHSTNVVFAKLADRGLDADSLRAVAERFLFNAEIAFPAAVEASAARIPEDPFGLASTAAGFGDVRLSPLHAALLASVVANGGLLVPPVIVDEVDGVPFPALAAPTRVIEESIAADLGEMMRTTVTSGTARRAFRRVAGPLRGVDVAGKTGSLADPEPYRDYSWFVGYAPADRPRVIVATVVVNERLWHARAPTVAKEALEAFFDVRVAGAPQGVRTAAVR